MLLLFGYVPCLLKHTCESLRQYWGTVGKVRNSAKFICFVLEVWKVRFGMHSAGKVNGQDEGFK